VKTTSTGCKTHAKPAYTPTSDCSLMAASFSLSGCRPCFIFPRPDHLHNTGSAESGIQRCLSSNTADGEVLHALVLHRNQTAERRRHSIGKTRKARLLPARNARTSASHIHERSLAAGRKVTTYLRWITGRLALNRTPDIEGAPARCRKRECAGNSSNHKTQGNRSSCAKAWAAPSPSLAPEVAAT